MEEREALEIINKLITMVYDVVEVAELEHRDESNISGYKDAIIDAIDVIASSVDRD